jgi:hypothetical protein
VEVEFALPVPANLTQKLKDCPGLRSIQMENARALVDLSDTANIPALVSALVAADARVMRVEPRSVTLEEIYFELRKNHGGQK